MTTNDNDDAEYLKGKWDFDDDEARGAAIESEAEHRVEEIRSAVDGRAREVEADANARARIAEAEADARGREAEARYGWVADAHRLARTCVVGGALFASFYYAPDFWPGVARVVSEIVLVFQRN